MKIVLVTESFAPATDQAAETTRHIADALIAGGHQVLVFTTTPGSGSYRGARVLRARALTSLPVLRRAVAEFRPDAVQFLTPRALGGAAMRTLENTGVPLFTLDPTPLHPRVGPVLASSEAGARALEATGIPARVWRPGVRADEHHPGLRSAALHDKWAKVGNPEGPLFVVGYVGEVRHAATKPTRRLAQVAGLPGVRLIVLGTGPGTEYLKGAGAKIVGHSSGLELARAIASLDLLVQPRRKETQLSAVRKALASGVPVVAMQSGAAAELVSDGVNGLVVDRGAGIPALARTVSRLSSDESLRGRLATGARPSVAGRTWAEAVEELIGLYARPAAVAV